ncbi:MAG: GHKL domain-containing protein [Oscillibacter sp.]|nr:GHKL domain-containing protein [Oscillibacter sp.]
MTAMFRMELTSALLVFAGHAASLFLMSLRRYTFRRSVMIWAGVLGLSALLTVALLWLSPAEGFLAGQVASLALCAVVFLCTSRGNFLRNLFIFASYINFFLFSIAASQALAFNFVDGDPVAVIEFRLILITVFCVVLVYDIRPAFLRAAENIPQGWGALTVLVCVFCGCLLSVAVMSNMFLTFTSQTLMMLVVLFVIMVSAYILIFKTIGALSKENQKRQLEMEKKFLTHQLSSFEQLEREERKYRHDFRHHNLLILEYAKNRDCDAIIQYLQEYEITAEKKLGGKVCANLTVNSIVTAFLKQAQERNIRMTTDIRMRKETAVRDTDLVAILANLLENAVKGCLLSEGEHWIDLTIVHKGGKLIIQCRNSCAGDLRFSGGRPQASGRVGIGITSIADAAASYAGDTEFFQEGSVFTGRILLNDRESSAN